MKNIKQIHIQNQFIAILVFFSTLFFFSCSSNFLKYDKVKDFFKNEEFDKKVMIKEVTPIEPTKKDGHDNLSGIENLNKISSSDSSSAANLDNQTSLFQNIDKQDNLPISAKLKKSKKKNKKDFLPEKSTAIETVLKRQPDLEDSEGFASGRRPLVDPFQIGEKIIHKVSYFGTTAGVLTLSVGPFVEVNGRKSYSFKTEIQSSRLFSSFYSVQDQVETFVDYIDLVPHAFKLEIKETGQLREAQSLFDHKNLKANYWEHKYTEKNGHEEKKQNWDILPYSQNAFSAIFYMRLFKWTVGKEYAFRVSDDEKNIIFKAKALEKVKLETEAGVFDAVKMKAEVVSRGALAQTGDLYFWMSDDDRKYVLRIEAKIKIGTLVSEISGIKRPE